MGTRGPEKDMKCDARLREIMGVNTDTGEEHERK